MSVSDREEIPELGDKHEVELTEWEEESIINVIVANHTLYLYSQISLGFMITITDILCFSEFFQRAKSDFSAIMDDLNLPEGQQQQVLA